MKIKKIAAVLICALLITAAPAGCGQEMVWPLPEEESPSQAPDPLPTEQTGAAEPAGDQQESDQGNGIDFDAAYAAFPPGTAMINAGGYTVTWAELYFNIHSNINAILQNFGAIQDWSEIIYSGMTFAETVLDYAAENALMYKAVEYGADLNGVTLGPDAYDSMREDYESSAGQYGGEEEFMRVLWEMDGISSRELFDYLVSTSYLASAVFTELYGANGELLSDEDAAEYTAGDGYLMAKHILRLRDEDDDGAALADIEDILEQLDNYDGDDFEAFFDGLMYEYSDDGGLSMFPNGYLFQYGDMMPEFYDACVALDIGGYSGVVETSYGYHIVYRIPINYDEIPSYLYSQYNFTTLRSVAAQGIFDSAMYGWMNALDPEYTAAYNSIDFDVIFSLS